MFIDDELDRIIRGRDGIEERAIPATYERYGVTLSPRKHGEGVVKWVDADNVLYERHWWRVLGVNPVSGRIHVCRIFWHDGEAIISRSWLTPGVSRLKHRPPISLDLAGSNLVTQLRAMKP